MHTTTILLSTCQCLMYNTNCIISKYFYSFSFFLYIIWYFCNKLFNSLFGKCIVLTPTLCQLLYNLLCLLLMFSQLVKTIHVRKYSYCNPLLPKNCSFLWSWNFLCLFGLSHVLYKLFLKSKYHLCWLCCLFANQGWIPS